MTDEPGELHRVVLRGLPMAEHLRSQEHNAELMREMYLIAQQVRVEDGSDQLCAQQHLPVRLLALVEELGNQFAQFTTAQDLRLCAAAEAGVAQIDLVYELPSAAADAARHLAAIFEEADQFCLDGHHLLTLSTPPELVAYRRWFLAEISCQLAGGDPTSWPEFSAA